MKTLSTNGFTENEDVSMISYDKLNRILRHFWFEIHQEDRNKYRASSLENTFHSINRFLKANKYKDLMKAPESEMAIDSYHKAI